MPPMQDAVGREGDRQAAPLAAVPGSMLVDTARSCTVSTASVSRADPGLRRGNGVTTPVLAILPTGDDPRALARALAPR